MENFQNISKDTIKELVADSQEHAAIEGGQVLSKVEQLKSKLDGAQEELVDIARELRGHLMDIVKKFPDAKLDDLDFYPGDEGRDMSQFPEESHSMIKAYDKMLDIYVSHKSVTEDLEKKLTITEQVDANNGEKSDIQRIAEIKDRVNEIESDAEEGSVTVTDYEAEAAAEALKVLKSMEDDMTRVNEQGEQII